MNKKYYYRLKMTSGFCYWASEFCFLLAQWASHFFGKFKLQNNKSILLIKIFCSDLLK